jgi:hypothetical protein
LSVLAGGAKVTGGLTVFTVGMVVNGESHVYLYTFSYF